MLTMQKTRMKYEYTWPEKPLIPKPKRNNWFKRWWKETTKNEWENEEDDKK